MKIVLSENHISWGKLGQVGAIWVKMGQVGTSWDELGPKKLQNFDIKKKRLEKKKKERRKI